MAFRTLGNIFGGLGGLGGMNFGGLGSSLFGRNTQQQGQIRPQPYQAMAQPQQPRYYADPTFKAMPDWFAPNKPMVPYPAGAVGPNSSGTSGMLQSMAPNLAQQQWEQQVQLMMAKQPGTPRSAFPATPPMPMPSGGSGYALPAATSPVSAGTRAALKKAMEEQFMRNMGWI